MKLLLVNQHYPPDAGATGKLVAQLAERLAQGGHDVTVLTGRPTYEESGRASAPRREERNGVQVVRLPLLPRRSGPFGRALHYLSFGMSLRLAGRRQPKPDVVMAWSSTPMFGGPAALAVARHHRCPFVYGVQDVYPEIAVALGVLRNRVLIRIARALERRAWTGAARVVVIGRGLREFAADRGIDPGRVTLIENWADTDAIRPQASSALRRELGFAEDDFVVQYAGNLGRSQGLDTVLEAARLIEDRKRGAAAGPSGAEIAPPSVRFLLVGSGVTAPEVRRRAEEVASVATVPFQSEDRLNDVLAAADLALVPLRAGFGRLCVPSKVYSILASGRPVGAMLDADSDVARIVGSGECGFRVDPDDPVSLADEILRLAAEPDRARRLGANGRAWGEDRGSLKRAAGQYEEMLENVIARSRSGV